MVSAFCYVSGVTYLGGYMLNFVALDFETANESKNSAISLAVVTVENGRITKRGYSLIKPPFMQFSQKFIDEVHGIQPEEVVNKPTFDQLWPAIYNNHLKDKLLVAHNAKFDIDVLRATLDHYNFEWPDLEYTCTVRISRKVWPDLVNHKLSTVGGYLGITFNHHNALDDSEVCAKIAIAAAKAKGVDSMKGLLHLTGLKTDSFITPERRAQMERQQNGTQDAFF